MIETLKRHLVSLDEAIEYAELTDTAYTYYYKYLVRHRKTIAKTIKKLEKIKKLCYKDFKISANAISKIQNVMRNENE